MNNQCGELGTPQTDIATGKMVYGTVSTGYLPKLG